MSWTHPIHARGIRSPKYDPRGGKLLTDKQIDQYTKAGRYGPEAQARAEAKSTKKTKPKRKKAMTVEDFLRILRKQNE